MILDTYLKLAGAQTHNAASTVAMTDTLDLTNARDAMLGEPLALVVIVKTALAGTSPTVAFAVQVDDNNSFSSPTTVAQSKTLSGAAAAPAGAVIVVPLPPLTEIMTASPIQAEFRYLRGQITLGGTGPSITFDAYIMPLSMASQQWRAHNDALVIS